MKKVMTLKPRIFAVVISTLLLSVMIAQTVAATPSAAGLEKQQAATQTRYNSLSEQKASLDQELTEMMGKIAQVSNDQKKCEAELKKAQEEAAAQYATMKDRIRYMYEAGDVNLLAILFESKSMADLLNKAYYISTISDYDRRMLEEFEDACNKVEAKKKELAAQKKELEELKKERLAKQEELAAEIENAAAALAAAQQALANASPSERAEAQQKVQAAEANVKQISHSAASTASFDNYGNPTWKGSVLTRAAGVNQGPSGYETYYNLNMNGVVKIMRGMGNNDKYWVRSDGVKMLGNYVMVGADFNKHPRGSIVNTSLGQGIVVDTGCFAYGNKNQYDIATAW